MDKSAQAEGKQSPISFRRRLDENVALDRRGAGGEIAPGDEDGAADHVADRHPQEVVGHAEERDARRVIAEQRDREHRHVGDRVLEAGGDEGEQAPPDQDAFPRVAGRPLASPQRQADEPVAQGAARDERRRRRAHFGRRGVEDEIGAVLEHLTAAAEPEDERQQNRAGEVADPAQNPGARHRDAVDRAARQSDGHEHRVAGEEVRAGKDDQGQRDAEAGAHDQAAQSRFDLLAEGEDEDDADADIGARQHRRDEEGERLVAAERRFGGGDRGEIVERLGEHFTLPHR